MPTSISKGSKSVFSNSKDTAKIHHKVKKVGNKDSFKEYLQFAMSICSMIYKEIVAKLLPLLFMAKSKCEENVSMDLSLFKGKLFCLPLVMEGFFMMFHGAFMVRFWIMVNFACTLLCIYDKLSHKSVKQRLVPISIEDIKKLSSVSIGAGACLVVFFTRTVGLIAMPCILYLINRTCKNAFDRGF